MTAINAYGACLKCMMSTACLGCLVCRDVHELAALSGMTQSRTACGKMESQVGRHDISCCRYTSCLNRTSQGVATQACVELPLLLEDMLAYQKKP